MSLQPVAGDPGLWRDPQWKPGMPGLYAVVAGVSEYPHLDGGSRPAPQTFELGQLVCSAGTAAAVFGWLRDGFRHESLAPVWCRLLLSPGPDEAAALQASLGGHWGRPTYAALSSAIQQWTGLLPVDPPASRGSRSFFFFSGHGVQANWNALLLPSDYLDPDAGLKPQLQHCISAAELRRWIEQHPAREHVALLDACRNEFSPLASIGATALAAFPALPPSDRVPDTSAMLSTSPNTVAFQLPGRALTVFGEALLEAVQGRAVRESPALPFRELVDYVKPRVNLLLREAGTTVEQTVRPFVIGDDAMVVTECAPPGFAGASLESLEAAPPDLPPSRVPRGAGGRAATRALARKASDKLLRVDAPITLGRLRSHPDQAHRRFGHEHTSALWTKGVQLFALADGRALDSGLELLKVSRDAAGSVLHLDLALAPAEGGVLLVLDDAGLITAGRLALALPTDPHERVPVRLSMQVQAPAAGRGPRLEGLSARLGPADWNEHYGYLWELAQQARLNSLLDAAAEADPERLQAAVAGKLQAPTAALAGALLLARAGQLRRLHDWPRNLMQWFPATPDGAAIWAEALRERGAVRGDGAAAGPLDGLHGALQQLLERGVPFFADAAELAQRVVREARRVRGADEATRRRLETLDTALQRVFEVAAPAGDFIVVAGLPRPAWMPGVGALRVPEMLGVLRGLRPGAAR